MTPTIQDRPRNGGLLAALVGDPPPPVWHSQARRMVTDVAYTVIHAAIAVAIAASTLVLVWALILTAAALPAML